MSILLLPPAGTLHAIGKGIVIAEVQQNSNVTYRVCGYGRLGVDGSPRALHVDKALDVTNRHPPVAQDFGPPLGQCPHFTTDLLTGPGTGLVDETSFVSLPVLEGSLALLRTTV